MDPTDNRQLILVTTVDIGGGMTDLIELYLGDEPEVSHSLTSCVSPGLCEITPTEHQALQTLPFLQQA